MFRDLFKNSNWFFKLVQLVVAAFLFTVIGYTLWTVIVRNDLESVNSLKLLQLISEVFLFIIPAMVLANLWYENPIEKYFLGKHPKSNQLALTVLLSVSMLPFINLMAYVNEQLQLPAFLSDVETQMKALENEAADITGKFLKADSVWMYLFNLLFIAIVPAFGEEIFFRGAVFNALSEKFRKHAAVWITAVLFSLIHFQMYGFLPRMVMGAIFGYLLVWSRSLWLPVLAHFLNNGMAVTASYLAGGQDKVQKLDTLGKSDTLWAGLLSTAISFLILWRIYKTRPTGIDMVSKKREPDF